MRQAKAVLGTYNRKRFTECMKISVNIIHICYLHILTKYIYIYYITGMLSLQAWNKEGIQMKILWETGYHLLSNCEALHNLKDLASSSK